MKKINELFSKIYEELKEEIDLYKLDFSIGCDIYLNVDGEENKILTTRSLTEGVLSAKGFLAEENRTSFSSGAYILIRKVDSNINIALVDPWNIIFDKDDISRILREN